MDIEKAVIHKGIEVLENSINKYYIPLHSGIIAKISTSLYDLTACLVSINCISFYVLHVLFMYNKHVYKNVKMKLYIKM